MDATASAGGTVGAGKAGVVAASVSWGSGGVLPIGRSETPGSDRYNRKPKYHGTGGSGVGLSCAA